jgi:hypothetical protein
MASRPIFDGVDLSLFIRIPPLGLTGTECIVGTSASKASPTNDNFAHNLFVSSVRSTTQEPDHISLSMLQIGPTRLVFLDQCDHPGPLAEFFVSDSAPASAVPNDDLYEPD